MSSASPAGGSDAAADGGAGGRGGAAASRPARERKEKKDKATRMREREQAASQHSPSPAQPQQQQEQSARAVIPIDDGGLQEPDGSHGDLLLVQSVYEDSRVWREVRDCDEAAVGQLFWLRARLSTVRSKGKFAFVVLRKGFSSVQALVSEGQHGWTRDGVKWTARIPLESVVDVFGQLVRAEQPTNTSQSRVEIQARKMFVVSLASQLLPFQLSDASRPLPDRAAAAATFAAATAEAEASPPEADKAERKEESGEAGGGGLVVEDGVITVGQDLRLDHRWIDLRTPANHAIFRIESRVCQYFRQFFTERDFIEIHTPKLTPGVSEGGAAVFRLKYFERDACLAQSPQLYKQMAICSDLSRVFEIGPVFRAEYSNTHRHLCEFTGLDFEMEIRQHYHEVLAVLSEALVFVFDQLNAHCKQELQAVSQQYPFTPLRYRKETLILPFSNAVKMLQDAGEDIGPEDDFSTPQEKRLGRLVSDKWGVDFYIVDQYPLSARPFYTMPSVSNPRFTNSYDVFVRGEEITSGAQRVHDVELLQRRARECGIPDAGIAAYVESFKFGAWPHGGAGIGLERVVMLFLGLDNIRKSSLFPRTPNRYTP